MEHETVCNQFPKAKVLESKTLQHLGCAGITQPSAWQPRPWKSNSVPRPWLKRGAPSSQRGLPKALEPVRPAFQHPGGPGRPVGVHPASSTRVLSSSTQRHQRGRCPLLVAGPCAGRRCTCAVSVARARVGGGVLHCPGGRPARCRGGGQPGATGGRCDSQRAQGLSPGPGSVRVLVLLRWEASSALHTGGGAQAAEPRHQ